MLKHRKKNLSALHDELQTESGLPDDGANLLPPLASTGTVDDDDAPGDEHPRENEAPDRSR